jgi:transposase
MDEIITGFVGLDAHAESTAIGFAAAGRAAPRFIGTVGPQRSELTRALGRLGEPGSLLIVYEAGPCGYGLARELGALGYRCEVVAPSKIPRKPGERIKTDRRDALKLARLARAGELTAVTIPDERDEAIRDLSRARVDAVRARLKARQQLQALLLRHGRRYTGKTAWTAAHERQLASISFAQSAQSIAFTEYRQAVSECDMRVRRLSEALAREVECWRMQAGGRRHHDAARTGPRGGDHGGCRARRPQALRPAARADGLSRPRALGAHHRREAQARRDHQDR